MASILAEKWKILDRYLENRRFGAVLKAMPAGCIMADLGCGDGELLFRVRGRVSVGYGIDAGIPDREVGNLKFLGGNVGAHIPLEDESLDFLSALAVLEHLEEPSQCVREIFRVLKKGGRCILTTPSPRAEPVLKLLAFGLNVISRKDIADHKAYYGRDDLKKMFCRFNSVEIGYFQLGLNTLVRAVK